MGIIKWLFLMAQFGYEFAKLIWELLKKVKK